jgi:hypothetical protein
MELTSARKSKGVGRFDGVFVSTWNKLRIHRKEASSVVDAKNLKPLVPTLAVDDDVKQRDEKDGDISKPAAMIMGPGGGVTTECVTTELLCGPIHRQHCQKQKQQRRLVYVMNCCDEVIIHIEY